LFAVVAGLWPMAHPAPELAELLRAEELKHLQISFEKDLRQVIHALLVGLRPDIGGSMS
jgi:hypothetical protein